MTSRIFALAGSSASATRKLSPNLARVVGPGLLVAVGYIDPGNWATDIAGGSGFGYALLSIVVLSAIIAMGFQVLVSRTALATGENLATLTARHLPRSIARASWIAGEAAILATALAELIGGAIALRLLFGISLISGVAITAVGTLVVLVVARDALNATKKSSPCCWPLWRHRSFICCLRPIRNGRWWRAKPRNRVVRSSSRSDWVVD